MTPCKVLTSFCYLFSSLPPQQMPSTYCTHMVTTHVTGVTGACTPDMQGARPGQYLRGANSDGVTPMPHPCLAILNIALVYGLEKYRVLIYTCFK